jgi:peptide/nickel transport system permease protein
MSLTGASIPGEALKASAAAHAPAVSDELPPPQRYWTKVWQDTFKGARARAGAAWISVLVVCAVFSPFIANSHPILMKIGGRWSSPLLQHMTPGDVILLVFTCIAAVAVFVIRATAARKTAILAAVLLVTATLSFWLVHPPPAIVYERYREWTKQRRIEAAIYAPIPYSPNDRLRDQPTLRLTGPTHVHWLGTEANGADVLSRILHASRIALAIGLISTGIAVIIGVIIGGIMGYFVGTVDILGMRLIEIVEAIPTLFLLITIVAFFGRNLYLLMAIIGLTSWTGDARFIRAEFLRLRNQDFVQAAIAAGLPIRSIIFRHMLPNGVTPVLISASFGVASAILYESTLSFLGLGLVDEPSWGQMLNQALGVGGAFVWWIAVFPGLAIFLTVFAYNLVGESLRDALDPRLRGVTR